MSFLARLESIDTVDQRATAEAYPDRRPRPTARARTNKPYTGGVQRVETR